jgi:hypothetical protein
MRVENIFLARDLNAFIEKINLARRTLREYTTPQVFPDVNPQQKFGGVWDTIETYDDKDNLCAIVVWRTSAVAEVPMIFGANLRCVEMALDELTEHWRRKRALANLQIRPYEAVKTRTSNPEFKAFLESIGFEKYVPVGFLSPQAPIEPSAMDSMEYYRRPISVEYEKKWKIKKNVPGLVAMTGMSKAGLPFPEDVEKKVTSFLSPEGREESPARALSKTAVFLRNTGVPVRPAPAGPPPGGVGPAAAGAGPPAGGRRRRTVRRRKTRKSRRQVKSRY